MAPDADAHLFLAHDMTEPARLSLAGGAVAAFTRRSPVKESPNEDSSAVISIAPDSGVLVVADGVGGARAGQQASAIAVEAIRDAVAESPEARPDSRGAILDGVERANRSILELGIGAATTLAVVEINGDQIRPYHVGDSTILLVGQRGKVKLQTIPHSPVGHALEAGVIDEHEALNHEERHVVSNIVGTEAMRIEVGPTVTMAARDTLLLASDGLADNMTEAEIVEMIRCGRLAKRVQRLASAVDDRMRNPSADSRPSKPDDLTILAFRRT
ncbi:MAG: serine/threonine-protein phosphatase [Planctomycetota bacterium]|nr:MAG: serine/threonine-protein phosphatase [Planctomycetota bacterium]